MSMGESQRAFAPLGRKSGIKTPDRIVVATEGEITEPEYFTQLAAKNSRIEVRVLERAGDDKSKSAPQYVLEQLRNFKKTEAPRKHDTLWLVVDVDRWQGLPEVARACQQEGFYMAVSNPCFELWLLLHLRSLLDEYTPEQRQEIWENKKVGRKRTRLDKELSDWLIDGYNKSNPRIERFVPFVKKALDSI